MTNEDPTTGPVLTYETPPATTPARPAVRLLSIFAAVFAFFAFMFGCGTLLLPLLLDSPLPRGSAVRGSFVYFLIAAVCAYASFRWSRKATSKRFPDRV